MPGLKSDYRGDEIGPKLLQVGDRVRVVKAYIHYLIGLEGIVTQTHYHEFMYSEVEYQNVDVDLEFYVEGVKEPVVVSTYMHSEWLEKIS